MKTRPSSIGLAVLIVCFCARAEVVLDVSNDYSTTSNPNPIWSYGFRPTVSGGFTPLSYSLVQTYGPNGVVHRWLRTPAGGPPSVQKNIGTGDLISDGGQGIIAPGVVWYGPGSGSDDAYTVIRCVIPADGRYRLRTVVSTYLQGPISGDCDFHVLKNGTELFGRFLPGSSGTSYSNTLQLVTGDVIDFAVGRGADDSSYASGLKIQATLTSGATLPPPALTYDVSHDFSLGANPNGPWSYGWKTTLNGPLGLLGFARTFSADNGVPLAAWQLSPTELPVVVKNVGNTTAISDGGRFTAPPGNVHFSPGHDGSPQNFGVIRFTLPAGGTGLYQIETAVQTLYDGTRSRDADFHVLKDGQELFGHFLSPNSRTGYSNVVHLAAGSTIDFVVGKGADGVTADSALKIDARLTRVTTPPPPPPPGCVFDVSTDFSTNGNPGGAWSYGYMNVLGGDLTLLTYSQYSPDNNGLMVFSWSKNGYEPVAVYKNQTSQTSISDGGYGVYPPGTVWFYGGVEGNVDNYGVIRFTAPAPGTYHLASAVRCYLDGPLSRDADYYVLKNGALAFSKFLGPNSATGYTNTFTLAAGDTIDFVCGRGQDNVVYGSGLKIQATLRCEGNPPPPPPDCNFDMAGDFSTNSNPGGAWSYGYVSALGGPFSTYNLARFSYGDNPVPAFSWSKNTYEAGAVYFNPSYTETVLANLGYGVFPPRTIWFYPGDQPEHPDKFAVIRLTIPAGSGGRYVLESAVQSHLNGALSGDADFHILKNGVEIFAHNLPPRSSVSYSNEVVVAAGDTIDFAVGGGPDGAPHGSGLKIQATLRCVGEPPPPGDCAPISGRGLVAWWRGEGNANDSAALNHGHFVGTPRFAPGKVGQGFLFDGNNYVLVPDNPRLDLTGQITIDMWFNSQEWGQGRTWALLDKRTMGDCNYGVVVSEPWGFQLYYNDPNVFGGDHPGNIFEISSFYPLPGLNQFHHFAGTFRQVDPNHIELKTYLDGALVQTRLFEGNLANTVNDMAIAIGSARGGADGGAFRGIIDEVSLYNRVLSADEVRAIYEAGSAGKCPPTFVNTPPAAHIALAPKFEVHGAPHAVVVACDGENAEIVLDGTGSTDADGDPLSYAWFLTGGQQPFSTEGVVRTTAGIGMHSVTLRVSDGTSSADATVVFEVITPAEAAAHIGLLLDAADLPRKQAHPLQASLRTVVEALERGNLKAGINHLGAFDNKVKAQLGNTHAALAASLSAATQALIGVLENCDQEE